ncbi:MAG: ATP-binding domain-containing protein, partial [Actinomycetota bacterium]|nr:ATP-binding domain-containing protein [Actinomycetota bacterium]
PRKIRGETLRALGARAAWSPRALTGYAYDRLEVWEGRELRGWLDDLSEVRAAAHDGGTVAALRTVRDLLEEGLAELDTSTTASKQTSSHLDDLTALIQVAPLRPDPAGFEPWLRAVLTSKETTDDPRGRVQLATVHATKGLEWPHVLLFGANEGLMPHRLSATTDAGGEEERRVFHVALTRARHEVVVLADRDHPSPYLAEMLEPADAAAPSAPMPVKGRPPGPATAPEAKPLAAARQPKEPSVVATVGVRLRAPGGITGTIASIQSDGVLLRLRSGARLHVPFGQAVTVDGEPGRLARSTD